MKDDSDYTITIFFKCFFCFISFHCFLFIFLPWCCWRHFHWGLSLEILEILWISSIQQCPFSLLLDRCSVMNQPLKGIFYPLGWVNFLILSKCFKCFPIDTPSIVVTFNESPAISNEKHKFCNVFINTSFFLSPFNLDFMLTLFSSTFLSLNLVNIYFQNIGGTLLHFSASSSLLSKSPFNRILFSRYYLML